MPTPPKPRLAKTLVACFFTLLLLVGLLTVSDYGAPYDELTEMMILHSNLKEYAIRLHGENSDNYFAARPDKPISQSVERDHGMCAYYPLAPLVPTLSKSHTAYSTAWSILTWLWFMLGCWSLYGLMRQLDVGRALSCAAVLLLWLSPRFFAEGHYNNKDVVLLDLFLATLWLGMRLMKKPGFARGVLFSLAGALATNIKIVGALPWGLCGLAVVAIVTAGKRWNRRMAAVVGVTVLSYAAFYLLVTPAAWGDPLAFFQYLISNATSFSRFGGKVLFRGANFWDVRDETPLPWYYLPYYILVTLPLYTLALAAFGQLRALFTVWRERARLFATPKLLMLAVVTLAWLVPTAYAVIGRPLLYNGWRHFYFVFAGMVTLAGYGASELWRLARGRRAARAIVSVALCACLGVTAVGLALNHPYEFSYYNALIKRDAKNTMSMDWWNVGCGGAYRALYEAKKDEPGQLVVGCYFNDTTIGLYKLPKAVRDKVKVTFNADEPYLYYGASFVNLYDIPEPPEGYHVLFTAKSYGNTIGTMYERD